jgi:peptidoglycan/xylan/chitin deacetylase (PgdA/CDA1 family)
MSKFFRVAIALLAVIVFSTGIATPAKASDTAPYRASIFTRGYDSSAKVATLTFDADWSNAGFASVLATLQANGITAAFSLTGRFVQTFPADARAVVAAGHKLVNHSYNHPYFSQLTQAERWWQLDQAEAVFRQQGLTSAGWFRAPYKDGYADPAVNRDLALRGYYVNFDWTYDTTGYQGASEATILARVRQYTVPGAIVVMHPGAGSTDPAALPAVISTLRGLGYTFISPQRTVTWGAIRAKYVALGAESSVFGAAITPELTATTAGTAVQWFQRGRIYWRRDAGPARYVFGAILTKYIALGTVTSYLGFPISDEVGVTGGRASQFQHGNIYWSSSTGAHVVVGAILARYLSLGGSGATLGLPTTDEYTVANGRRSDFQHGSITWDQITKTTTVVYA